MTRAARAAAVVPRLEDGRVLVGNRTRHARSWPGTLAFPGGACEEGVDDALPLFTGHDRSRACALRELGEEVGLWSLCRRDGTADAAAAAATVDDILRGATLGDALHKSGMVLDDRALVPLLAWRTWDGRFSVQQFLLPLSAPPSLSRVLVDELDHVRFADPIELRRGWRDGEVFLIPPIRRVLVELARVESRAREGAAHVADVVTALQTEPNARERARPDLVEGVQVLSMRTPTLPPATHTNTVVLGAGDVLVVDPATPYEEEQDRFDRHLSACLGNNRVTAIVCTHHHHDHVGDVARLRRKLGVPVWAHKETASRVDFPVDRHLEDGELLVCQGDPERAFRVVFTPGHARGHICLFEEKARVLVAGDMVAGVGSILIDPPEGHMGTYLASLARLRDLAPRALIPSHGPLLVDGTARLEEQLAHRAMRQASVEAQLSSSAPQTIHAIVQAVYGADTPPTMLMFAERSVLAALELARESGRARELDGAWTSLS